MNDSTLSGGLLKTLSVALLGLTMAGCSDSSWWSSNDEPELKAEQIKKLIPSRVHDRQSWANDIDEIMQKLSIAKTKDNVCTGIAVVDQESNFVANPVVAGLGEKSVREVSTRLNEKFEDKLGKTIGGPVAGYFEDVLKNQPSKEDNYMSQMRKVRTEQDLDVLYREMFDYMAGHYHVSAITGAAKLVGQDIAEKMNPITTLGSMQVNIVYAKEHKRVKLQSVNDLRDDLYTQYGGLYYGIHRLMLYKADYSKPLYRFADYNSGMYSSRNASVQDMINKLSGEQLTEDGDMLLYSKDGSVLGTKSSSEKALIKLFTQNNILITPNQIRTDLKLEKTQSFEQSPTYIAIIKLYEKQTGKDAPYAIMPQVVISGPKLSRDYNTNWYATRVNGRYQTCMQRAKRIKL